MANHLQQLQLTTPINPSPTMNHAQAVDGTGVSHYMAEVSYYPYATPDDPFHSWEQPCTLVCKQQMVCDDVPDSLESRPWETVTPTYHPAVADMDHAATRPYTLSTRRKQQDHHSDSTVAIRCCKRTRLKIKFCACFNDLLSYRLIPPTPTLNTPTLNTPTLNMPTLNTPTPKASSDNSSLEVLLEDVSEDSGDDSTTRSEGDRFSKMNRECGLFTSSLDSF